MNTAIDIIELLCAKLGIVVDVANENLLPYIQELMQQLAIGKTWSWIAGCLLSGFIFVISIFVTKWGAKHMNDDNWETSETGDAALTIGVAVAIVAFVVFCVAITHAIQWSMMPTVMGYKWIADTLK